MTTVRVCRVMARLGELDFYREPDCLQDDPSVCADPHMDVPIASTLPHPGYRVRLAIDAGAEALPTLQPGAI